MNQELVSMVNKMINEKFEVPAEKLVPTARLKEDLNLDSLDFVDMVVLLEQKTSFEITDIDFTKIQTLQDIYNLVQTLTDKTV